MSSDLMMAIDNTARQYRDGDDKGFAGVAKRLGQSPNYFSNKVSASYEGAHLTPDELIALMDLTGDYQILHTMARSLSNQHTCIPLKDWSGVSDTDLLDAHLALSEDQGETSKMIREAISKGFITRKDLNEIEREMHEDIQCMYELRGRLEGMVQE